MKSRSETIRQAIDIKVVTSEIQTRLLANVFRNWDNYSDDDFVEIFEATKSKLHPFEQISILMKAIHSSRFIPTIPKLLTDWYPEMVAATSYHSPHEVFRLNTVLHAVYGGCMALESYPEIQKMVPQLQEWYLASIIALQSFFYESPNAFPNLETTSPAIKAPIPLESANQLPL